MKTTNSTKQTQQVLLSEDSPMFMETFERNHVEQVYQFYQSVKEQLLCWGEEPKYPEGEFSNTFERKDQGETGNIIQI
ncbi:hypothetical protein [Flavobacterium pectinovorum]|uniref:Uncharacterized protein n=1 Tax=Flavobacterium pectinovorum TaxID=29533 RepID=A0A502EBQ3_9FLAO|nr:hypothetical protein [Flavobacterium pectinovorum]TPG33926.1 hypothetical protein EAH81_23555 [Flavobacterium pectinovorum]